MEIEVSKKLIVTEVPQSAGVVGHGIHSTRNEVGARDIAVVPLVQGVQAKQICPS